MKNILFTVLLMLVSLISYSQALNTLPLTPKFTMDFVTIYKNDSVVIITLEKSIQINKLIDEQSKRIIELESMVYKDNKEKGKLLLNIDKKDSLISILDDSLNIVNNKYKSAVVESDSLETSINIIENWLVDASVANTLIYYDYRSNSIKMVDFNSYKSKFNIFGRFKFIPLNVNYSTYHQLKIRLKKIPFNEVDRMTYENIKIIDCPIKININP